MDLKLPLSKEELDELDAFLASDNAPTNCMGLSQMDGFITAIVCEPEMAPPSQWLPIVWGGEDEPEFDSEEQGLRIMELLFRLMNGISVSLAAGPGGFEPLLYLGEIEGKTRRMADAWCAGFIICLEWRYEWWKPFVVDKVAIRYLFPIAALVGDAKGEEFRLATDTPEKRDELIGMIPLCVDNIYEFWLNYRHARPIEGAADNIYIPRRKIGRNQPCPCGSGRKYKKCCGGPNNMD